MNRDKILVVFSSFLLFVGFVGLLLRQPINGVDRDVSFSYQNRDLTLDMKDQYLLEAKYDGTFDEGTDTVIIATRDKSIWNFMDTCSHELEHVKDFGKRHSEFQDYSRPWNWKVKCFNLLKYRT